MDFRSQAGHVFPGSAHVILHVAAAQNAARVHIFKSGKDFLGRALGHLHDDIQPAAVAHAHHQFHRALLPGGVQNFIHQRDHGRDALQGEALTAEISLLQYLLEQVGPYQAGRARVSGPLRAGGLPALLYPAPPFGISNVYEFRAHGPAIDAAGFVGKFALNAQARVFHRRKKPEGIEVSLQISPVAERVEYALTFTVGSFENSGCGRWTCRFGSGRHRSLTRITDAMCAGFVSQEGNSSGISLPTPPHCTWGQPPSAVQLERSSTGFTGGNSQEQLSLAGHGVCGVRNWRYDD